MFFISTILIIKLFACGESGIRTRDTLLAYTRFPGVPLQPLEHLSFNFSFNHSDSFGKRVQSTEKIRYTKFFAV